MKPPRLSRGASKAVLAAELHMRRHGEPPTWTELQRAAGFNRLKLVSVLEDMRRKGLVDFVDEEPRSLRISPEAIRMALERVQK